MDFDFSSINENALEYEIFSRPWGFYKTTILNELFKSKVIYVMPDQALSLQSHHYWEEYWIVIYGEGTIQIGESVHLVSPGQYFFIPKDCKHRLTNTSKKETLILTEYRLEITSGKMILCGMRIGIIEFRVNFEEKAGRMMSFVFRVC